MAAIDQFHRYRVINNLLRNSGEASLQEMVAACKQELGEGGTSESSLEKDIRRMRKDPPEGFKAPILYDRKSRKYRYTIEGYSIDGIPLLEGDLKNLVFAASVLNQYKGITHFELFQGAVQRIVNITNQVKKENNARELDFIEFEKSPLTAGGEYLERVMDHIDNREVVEMTYQAFNKDKPAIYILHPYYLKEYMNRWYVLALDQEANKVKTFGLERIKKIKALPDRHYRQSHMDFSEHFKNVIGIMIPDERQPENVIVAFTEFQSKYAISQPIHASQTQIEKSDKQGRVYFKYHLIPNFELTQKLLGWSDQVEVISPEWYREEVKNTVEGMGKVYQ